MSTIKDEFLTLQRCNAIKNTRNNFVDWFPLLKEILRMWKMRWKCNGVSFEWVMSLKQIAKCLYRFFCETFPHLFLFILTSNVMMSLWVSPWHNDESKTINGRSLSRHCHYYCYYYSLMASWEKLWKFICFS